MSNAVPVPAAALLLVCLCVTATSAVSGTQPSDDASRSKPRDYMTTSPAGAHSASTTGARQQPVTRLIASGTIANVAVCTALYDQLAPALTRDGSGGGITVWQDYRSGQLDIFAQKMTSSGMAGWSVDGIPVCKAPGNQTTPRAIPDGAGGAIVVWQDGRADSTTDIYAQRISSLGGTLWSNVGVAICTAVNQQRRPVIVADGLGGAIIAWIDERALGSDVYAQRINAAGVVQWAANGVALSTATGAAQGLSIVTDGQRGAIVAWQDLRSDGGDVYARRVNESGAPQWTADGVAVCATTGAQDTPVLEADGMGGAIVGWADARGAAKDIYAQRVNASGAAQWAANGVGVCTASGDQQAPGLSADGASGAFVVWQDGRGASLDVYAQRVNGSGVAQWAANGVGVCTAAADQMAPAITADPVGGAVVAWSDARTPTNGADIYVQHLTTAGASQWAANGVLVCDAANGQDAASVVADGVGGAAVVWRDLRSGSYSDLYGQRVDATGMVPDQCTPPDTLSSDLPISTIAPQNYKTFDQGWFYWSGVGVRGAGGDWDIEVYDQGGWGLSPYPNCFGAPLAGSFGTSNADFVIGNFNDNQTPPGEYGVRAYRYSGSGGATIEWDSGANDIVKDGPGVSNGPSWTGVLDVYDVQLTGGITYWFWLSHGPADIKLLVFTSYGSPDYYYVVPRSSRVAEGSGGVFTYVPPATGYYGVAVVNDDGVGTSYTVRVLTSNPVGVEPGVELATGLRGVAPNPSAGRTQIQFALRQPGEVGFDVVDMAGRVVTRIPGRHWEAGTWSVAWDGRTSRGTPAAAGIYFVQMRVDGRRVGLGRLALIR